MNRQIKFAAVIVLLVISFTGCALMQTATEQPFTQWSPKKQLTYAINIYTTEYDKYMAAALNPDLTAGQKSYLRNKRLALIGLDNIINILLPYADMNQPFPADLQQKLTTWLTQLGYQPM